MKFKLKKELMQSSKSDLAERLEMAYRSLSMHNQREAKLLCDQAGRIAGMAIKFGKDKEIDVSVLVAEIAEDIR